MISFKKELEEKYGVTFHDDPMSFACRILYKNTLISVDAIELYYQDITHTEEDGEEEEECSECGYTHMETQYKRVVDVKAEDLTEKQKAKQRKPIEDMIEEMKIKNRRS